MAHVTSLVLTTALWDSYCPHFAEEKAGAPAEFSSLPRVEWRSLTLAQSVLLSSNKPAPRVPGAGALLREQILPGLPVLALPLPGWGGRSGIHSGSWPVGRRHITGKQLRGGGGGLDSVISTVEGGLRACSGVSLSQGPNSTLKSPLKAQEAC